MSFFTSRKRIKYIWNLGWSIVSFITFGLLLSYNIISTFSHPWRYKDPFGSMSADTVICINSFYGGLCPIWRPYFCTIMELDCLSEQFLSKDPKQLLQLYFLTAFKSNSERKKVYWKSLSFSHPNAINTASCEY